MILYHHAQTRIAQLLVLFLIVAACRQLNPQHIIDREALIKRHTITLTSFDSLSSLTLGNGKFAYTADFTGMQTFPEEYEGGIPLGTMSDWGWHSFPNSEEYVLSDVAKLYAVGEDSVPYWYQFTETGTNRQREATIWLRENPHRFHLGIVGLDIKLNSGESSHKKDYKNVRQTLDLWQGVLNSEFEVERAKVEVTTFSHPEKDAMFFAVKTELLETGQVKFNFRFPYASHDKFSPGYEFGKEMAHITKAEKSDNGSIVFHRVMDDIEYKVKVRAEGTEVELDFEELDRHEYLLSARTDDPVVFLSVQYLPEKERAISMPYEEALEKNRLSWMEFWNSGGAVDFSTCTDERAHELERRVVLSQYLTRVQCAGILPPQETGLTFNSWHGKYHLEMIWWHALHFILWQREELITDQLVHYNNILPEAEKTSAIQKYSGIRWPKMVGPAGRESPSSIGVFLIWQQPHIIYFAELLRQNAEDPDSLVSTYAELVGLTADFMADYARWDSTRGEYVLGPALIPAQERFNPESTINPSFELAYWHWGLQTAQKWRKLSGKVPSEKYQHVLGHLAPLPEKSGAYLFTENAEDSYTNPHYLTDHPMVLGMLGFLPEMEYVDLENMCITQSMVDSLWNWETIWGWDIPLAAMNAVLLDKPEKAIDYLLMDTPKNTYLANGHNYQHETLPVYLPGNGGILSAVALMCTYRGKNGQNGFPADGKWKVKFENLNNWIE